MIVRSRAGQSAIGITMTGAASISVPDTIDVRAKTPRPRTGLARTSMRWLGIGRRRPISAGADTRGAGFRRARADDQQHPQGLLCSRPHRAAILAPVAASRPRPLLSYQP